MSVGIVEGRATAAVAAVENDSAALPPDAVAAADDATVAKPSVANVAAVVGCNHYCSERRVELEWPVVRDWVVTAETRQPTIKALRLQSNREQTARNRCSTLEYKHLNRVNR